MWPSIGFSCFAIRIFWLTLRERPLKSPRSFCIVLKELAPHIAIIAEGVSLKELALHCERRVLLRLEGVSDPMAIGVVG